MSSSRFQPSATPRTALLTRLRARPWNLSSSRSSRALRVTSWPSSTTATTPGGSACFICPFGPFTSTPASLTLTVTPLGIAIVFFPILDMASPNVAEDLAADAQALRGATGHHALRGREDVHAQSAEHRRNPVTPRIDAETGATD